MVIPSTVQQLLITLLLVIPGFVYQETRVRFRGRLPTDTELTSRLLRAIATSTLFALVYISIASATLTTYDHARDWVITHPVWAAVLAFTGAFGIPFAVATAPAAPWVKALGQRLPRPKWLGSQRYDVRPTAWDVAFQQITPGFVRIKTKDGTWYAGYFDEKSYASAYPDPRSLYLSLAYRIGPDGTIQDVVEGSRGVIIDCTDAVFVELLAPDTDTPDQAQ